ncbi:MULTISPECIES: bifunctional 5,10-methylenetetrahydrofolate dehydrogenase/5,10-methenyltetrahydrofolate cyclohydrolase [unclassified Mycoplasma]
MSTILDGRIIRDKIKQDILDLAKQYMGKMPSMAIIQVGNLFESTIYVNNKINFANQLGFKAKLFNYPDSIQENELIAEIRKIQVNCDGLIVQLPLPKHINKQNVLDAVDIEKDIDGLNSKTLSYLEKNNDVFLPATALGVVLLMKYYNIDFYTQEMGIIGQSNLVGYPLYLALRKHNSNISVYTKETLKKDWNRHKILIVATGVKHLIDVSQTNNEATIIDVGIHRDENNKITGDCDFNSLNGFVKNITPVPGGVGPMTILALIINLMKAFGLKNKEFYNHFKQIIDLAKL